MGQRHSTLDVVWARKSATLIIEGCMLFRFTLFSLKYNTPRTLR